MNNVLVLFATFAESERFLKLAPKNTNVVVCGVGAVAAAVATLRFIELYKPDYVILAGIAGAFEASNLELGKCVVVSSEYNGDLGSFSGGSFEPKFAQSLSCDSETMDSLASNLPKVSSLCVNSAASPFVGEHSCAIENMEGWGFFKACLDSQTKFLELRAISNTVGDKFENWDITTSLENLTTQLQNIISRL